jgi:hypothetical protein
MLKLCCPHCDELFGILRNDATATAGGEVIYVPIPPVTEATEDRGMARLLKLGG